MKILMLIKTIGLKYDDRLRKESLTLKEFGYAPELIILDHTNQKFKGIAEYGIPFYSISLVTRKILPQCKGLFIKSIEMYIKFLFKVLQIKPPILWITNYEMMGFIPICWVLKNMGFIEKLVWDQYELPSNKMINNKLMFKIICWCLKRCDVIITANKERKEWMVLYFGKQFWDKIKVVQNFPDNKLCFLPEKNLSESVNMWLHTQQYLLAQGGWGKTRCFEELAQAVLEMGTYKLIVIGYYDIDKYQALRKKWGKHFDDLIFFTGMIPQMEVIKFIDHALASIILYSSDSENRRLCASNRLYQALCRGVPVVVGCNQPMKNLVHKYDFGVVLGSDGRNVTDIKKGISELNNRLNRYKKNAQLYKNKFVWEAQKENMAQIVS